MARSRMQGTSGEKDKDQEEYAKRIKVIRTSNNILFLRISLTILLTSKTITSSLYQDTKQV